jgi:hypothetical protein
VAATRNEELLAIDIYRRAQETDVPTLGVSGAFTFRVVKAAG